MTYEVKQKFSEYLEAQKFLSKHGGDAAKNRAYYKVYGFIQALEELELVDLKEAIDLIHIADDVINA